MLKKQSHLMAMALVFFTLLAVAQTQMPNDKSGEAKPVQSSGQKTLTGIVTDTMCGAQHMEKDRSPAECTRMCVKQGMKYALASGDKLYTLQGHEDELDKLAGEKATVKGTVSGETMTVDSVVAAAKSAK